MSSHKVTLVDPPKYNADEAGWDLIPDHMIGGLRCYIEDGIEPGSFLKAVICNDLAGAVGKADSTNIHSIVEYVYFFYNYAPAGCWGSVDNYKAWIKQGGLNGRNNKGNGTD